MNNVKFGIASYKRPECRTVQTLVEAGVDKADIFISTQTEEDYEQYAKRHDVQVFFEKKDCAGGNRNTLISRLNAPLMLLDDDITGFSSFIGGKWVKDTENALNRLKNDFSQAEANGCCCFGVSATTNGIVTRNRYEYDFDVLLQGTVIGLLDTRIRFDERWKMVEDYEISLRVLRSGGKIMRNNYLCAIKPKNGTNAGGLHKRYADGELPHWISLLERTYPQFKANKEKTGGQIRREHR